MQRNRRWIMAATAALACLAVSPAQADVKAGVDAWQAGNYSGAIGQWRPLAEKGDPDAQFNMGQAYKLGRGVPTDLKLAQTWYEKAAQQGHEQAQANLGLILFQNGQRAAAMPWISKASDHGDPRAQYVLGTALFNGDLVAKDWPRAYALMTRAAAQGLPQATSSLTEMDKYMPLSDRQKGTELARAMERGSAVLAEASPAASKPATARPGPKPVAVPPSKPPVPAARPPVQVARAAPTPATAKPTVQTAAAPGGKWRVQLGAFGSPQIARSQWAAISQKVGALAGLQPHYEPAGALTRLRVGPLANRAAADRVCAGAKSAGQACFVVAP
jgi:cell division septation protein DedD